jgi:hypothetical protein
MALLNSIESSPLAELIRESDWAFPAIESVHVIALALVVGTITIVDLRLLGLASAGRAYSELARLVLPWTWGAFVLAAMSGVAMFVSQPQTYLDNLAFRIKLLLLLLAGINMLVFQLIVGRGVPRWDHDAAPVTGRIAAALSLVLWIAIVFFGRRIGFTRVST